MKPIYILTDDSDLYMTVYYPIDQSIQAVVEFVITEVQTRRLTRMQLDLKEFYFAYGANVIALKIEPEGTLWKIL